MPSDATLYAFTNALQPARRSWNRAAGEAVAGNGLTVSLATVVLFASRLGPLAQQRALAFELGINPSALVRLLDQGEAAGLIERRDAPGDRRSKLVAVLPPGRGLVAEMEKALARRRAELLGDIPSADIETATRVLRLLGERVAGSQENKE